MTDKEALKLALEALENSQAKEPIWKTPIKNAITAIKQALAADVQEPVVFYRCNGCGHAYEQVHPTSCDCMEAGGFDRVEYYTAPPAAQRQWVGLTDEEENALIPDPDGSAEANVKRGEVLPGAWGKEYEEVDAWSKPLVLQMLRDHEAKLKERNQ